MTGKPSQLIVLAGISFIAWAAILAVGVVFIVSGFNDAKTQYADLRLQINQFGEKNIKYEQSLESYKKVSADVDGVNSSFVGGDTILNLLVQLEGKARDTNNSYSVAVIQDIPSSKSAKGSVVNSGGETAAPILPGTVLTISLTGTFANIFQFVNDVEHLPYFIQVQRLTIRAAAVSKNAAVSVPITSSPQLQAIFVMKVFSPAP
ncbi:MAG: hypothetical protein HYV65_01035 [Candidatus Spechtbacteria bacterium]|nr:hypothetical protein [Candidatus Spechtbacteria bacterium]